MDDLNRILEIGGASPETSEGKRKNKIFSIFALVAPLAGIFAGMIVYFMTDGSFQGFAKIGAVIYGLIALVLFFFIGSVLSVIAVLKDEVLGLSITALGINLSPLLVLVYILGRI